MLTKEDAQRIGARVVGDLFEALRRLKIPERQAAPILGRTGQMLHLWKKTPPQGFRDLMNVQELTAYLEGVPEEDAARYRESPRARGEFLLNLRWHFGVRGEETPPSTEGE